MPVRQVIKFGPFEFDPPAGLLYQGDEETLLPPKAAGVLHVLLENSAHLVTKDELLERVWAGAYVTESSLTDAISLLRQVLGDDSRDPTCIQTLHRRGYRFIAPVVQAVSDAGVEGAEEEGGAAIPPVEPTSEADVRDAGGWTAGDTLGNYEILDTLGAGAMGTVYRARDTSLEREVAIKALPVDFANDPERVARLDREAKLLASVSHPNIAAIHSLEESDGIRFPVFELVEGETLEQKLRLGRLQVEEALEIGRQIASALEAAHDQGIIHRDLKPGNVVITPEGQAKVLDFGLAKALEVKVFDGAANTSPTESIAIKGSRRGSIVGTAAYMSPEQARGQEVDKRADIWSFGSVLYELLTGRRPFEGETVSDTIAGVLEREPDWNALPPETPALVRSLLCRVLQKDPANRLHDIADARIEIDEARSEPGAGLPSASGVLRQDAAWRRAMPWGAGVAVGAMIAGLAVWMALRPSPPSPPAVARWAQFNLPPGDTLRRGSSFGSLLAISPDGRHLAYTAQSGETQQLFLRRMDLRDEVRPISGSEGAYHPFFSPDSNEVGFFAYGSEGHMLKTAAIGGGLPILVSMLSDWPTQAGFGASWEPDGSIIFAQAHSGGYRLMSVPAGGGELTVLLEGGNDHYYFDTLPGGKTFLTTYRAGPFAQGGPLKTVAVFFPETGDVEMLEPWGMSPRYVPTGHVVFARDGSLWAMPFDLGSLEAMGEPVRVLEDLLVYLGGGIAHYSFSADGTLVFVPGGAMFSGKFSGRAGLVWVDREGNETLMPMPARHYIAPSVSPDGKRVAVLVRPVHQRLPQELRILGVERPTDTRLAIDGGFFSRAAWAPDGESVVLNPNRNGVRTLQLKRVNDDSAEPEWLCPSGYDQYNPAWSPDQQFLAYNEGRRGTGWDIWVMPLAGECSPTQFIYTDAGESYPAFSPDGKWLAYQSNESGRNEVYITSFPGREQTLPVSIGGGQYPRWAASGDELFYLRIGRASSDLEAPMVPVFAVKVEIEPELQLGTPELLFEGRYLAVRHFWDVAPDGERFLMIKDVGHPGPRNQIIVVTNWFEDLRRLAPPGQ